MLLVIWNQKAASKQFKIISIEFSNQKYFLGMQVFNWCKDDKLSLLKISQ